jgi:epoxyqueuosine reductase
MNRFLQIDLQSLKDEIKTEAFRFGFSHLGFTNPDRALHFDTFLEWINNGFAAEMDYLKRPDSIARRKDFKLILPACKSIIVVAIPYTPPGFEKRDNKYPKIANYAIGDDYHIIIPDLLEKLVNFIVSKVYPVEVEYRIYTDTGPILEKELAQKAGLGWIGKNSCLIIPEAGSFFFLAEILINLPFDPDSVFEKDFCGNCSRCIDSCPTNCILPNRTIDANQCISYLTIENRSTIPEKIRERINGWIFGCDICQQVCPWNIKFSKEPEPNFFQSSESIQKFNIISELKLDKSEFKNKYSKSPIYRAKYEGYKRNLLIAAGNNFNTELFEPIFYILNNGENPDLQELANWVLKNKNE